MRNNIRSQEHQKLIEWTWMSNVMGSEFISTKRLRSSGFRGVWCWGRKMAAARWCGPWALYTSLPRAQAPRPRYSESLAILNLAFSSYSCAFANAFPSLWNIHLFSAPTAFMELEFKLFPYISFMIISSLKAEPCLSHLNSTKVLQHYFILICNKEICNLIIELFIKICWMEIQMLL